jgi:hypothetical protein
MGMLDRYKKKGGFIQLLNLIETSAGKKQEQFLGLISQESPAWEQELKTKRLNVARILSWPEDVLSEVISRIQPLTLCVTLHGRAGTEVERVLAPLPPITKRKLIDQMSELNPSPAERQTCEMKLIAEVRSIVALGVIKFEKFDGDLFIDENIEERLNSAESGVAYLNKIEVRFSQDSGGDKNDVSASGSSGSGAAGANSNSVNSDIEMFRRKVNQLNQENAALKQEIQILRDKLAQIKKIA